MSCWTESVPKVSVVIPCRNEKNHIEAVVRSILDQESSTGDFEVIIADGMSDDSTREILEKFSRIDSRVIVVDIRSGRLLMV